MQQTKNELFETAPVYRAFFALTLPSVLGKIVTLFYNMADTWFIASTQNADLVAGVSLVGPVFTLMIAVGDIFGVGGSSLISRLFGQDRGEDARRVSAFCFWGALGGGAALAVLLLLFQTPVLRLLGADAATLPYAAEYYRCIAVGAPLIVCSIVPLNLLRTEGMATASMLGSALGSVVNLVLDPLFIFGLGLGAGGAAIATVLGNAASVALYVYLYGRRARWLSVAPRDCKVTKKDVKGVLTIGIPASVNNIMVSFSTMLTNRFLYPYGSEAIAAMGIASKINMIALMLLISFAFGSQPLVGYNYGRADRTRLRAVIRFLYRFEVGVAAALTLVLGALAPTLVRAFMRDAAIVAAGTQMLRALLAGSVFAAIVLISTCVFQSAGKGTAALTLAVSWQGVVFAAVLAAASALWGYNGILAAKPLADAITAVLAAALMARVLGRELRQDG